MPRGDGAERPQSSVCVKQWPAWRTRHRTVQFARVYFAMPRNAKDKPIKNIASPRVRHRAAGQIAIQSDFTGRKNTAIGLAGD